MPKKIILFNPRSAASKPRIPNSILQVAATLVSDWEPLLVDGNREEDPWKTIEQYLRNGDCKYFGCTVMPGPQLSQAIPYSQRVKQEFPDVTIIWGGYFAANQYSVCMQSSFIDYIINGPGDETTPRLLAALENGTSVDFIPNLIYRNSEGKVIVSAKGALPDYNTLPTPPYAYLNQFYSLDGYLGHSFLGRRTIAYHSSFGCPFTCSFCGIVPIYNARWKAKNPQLIADDILWLKEHYDADAVEFHDNNFFVSRSRVLEFSELMLDKGIQWWGEARIDTLDKYTDEDLALMRKAGCRMIFFGAESGNDEVLAQMNKGGKQTGAQILRFAKRMAKADIIPEYSFVLGAPADTEASVWQRIRKDMEFIRDVKTANPATEIIIYIYSAVPTEGSELYEAAKSGGFRFPETLEDWLRPEWQQHDLRKNPMTPWLKPEMVDYIKDFETVLQGMHPSVSDFRMSSGGKKLLHALAQLRYRNRWYRKPLEIRKLQSLLRYTSPEIEGFYLE